MSVFRRVRGVPTAFGLLGLLLVLSTPASPASAQATVAPAPAVSVLDLERLVQQIEDPQQREQLLKTLQALIAVARTAQPSVAPQDKAGPLVGQSEGIFLAFGMLTEYLSTASRKLGRGLAAVAIILERLPARLKEPWAFRRLIHMGVAVGVLGALAIILRLIAICLGAKLRHRAPAIMPIPLWQKGWVPLLTVGLAVGPYFLLLVASGVVLSVFPVGIVLSGLVALVISTVIFIRLTRAIMLVLLNPDERATRLLSISDDTSHFVWTWGLRLTNLSAAYYVVTGALRTIGVADEFYYLVRGAIVVMFPILLTVLVARLAQTQRARRAEPEGDGRPGTWSSSVFTLQHIWPIIAIVYIWCTAVFAMAGFRQGVTYMVVASLQTATVIGSSLLLLWAGSFAFSKAVALTDRVGQYLPGLEVRTFRYLTTLWWGARLIIILGGTAAVLQVWGIGISWFFTSPVGSDLLSRLLTLVFTVAIVALVVDLSAFVSQKLVEPGPHGEEMSKKRKTLIPLVGTVITYGALLIGGLAVLHQVGVNITPILAGVGILGLAVGFGAQTLVKDIINGLFMLFEDSIAVGDVVNIKGTGGLVEAVNLRTIRLRDEHGSVHIIPNSQVETITNLTKEFSYYVLEVGVAYHEDTDEVIAALQEIDAGLREDPAFACHMLAPIEVLGVDQFTDSAVILKARLKTKPIKQGDVGREFNRRMKKLFDARGIEIPFPHRTIYWGHPKQGETLASQLAAGNREVLAGESEPVDARTLPPDRGQSEAH